MSAVEFRIADTFTDSLARLTGDEQKAVKTTAFDLQLSPENPGLSFHKLVAIRVPGSSNGNVWPNELAIYQSQPASR